MILRGRRFSFTILGPLFDQVNALWGEALPLNPSRNPERLRPLTQEAVV